MRNGLAILFLALISLSEISIASEIPVNILEGLNVATGENVKMEIKTARLGTVAVFLSARCPCSGSHEPVLKKIYEEYSPKGVQIIGIHSNMDEDATLTKTHFLKSALPFPVIQDRENYYANRLNALKTPHVFVFSKTGEILYRGGVDDSQTHIGAKKDYLRIVLEAWVQEKELPYQETRSLGCVIPR